MNLFLVRHAIAEEAKPGQADADRELTDEGESRFHDVVKGLRALSWRFDRVLASPWRRAWQTAKLLEPVCDGDITETELLAQAPSKDLLALIAETPTKTTAVVGHEPWLGVLASWLAFGDGRVGEAIMLKKGGVVWLEGPVVPGGMMLRAIVPPKVFRGLT